VLILD
jgi:hypothetical protein